MTDEQVKFVMVVWEQNGTCSPSTRKMLDPDYAEHTRGMEDCCEWCKSHCPFPHAGTNCYSFAIVPAIPKLIEEHKEDFVEYLI